MSSVNYINPEILQTYLLSKAHKLIKHSKDNSKYEKLYTLNYSGYGDSLITGTKSEEITLNEINAFSRNFTYDQDDYALLAAIPSNGGQNVVNSKEMSLDKFEVSLVLFKNDIVGKTSIVNEINLSNVLGFTNEQAELYYQNLPFKINEIEIENLSRDIFTTKVSQKGGMKIEFKSFGSLEQKIRPVMYDPNVKTDNIEFSLLNLITYGYEDNGNIRYGLKIKFGSLQKLILISPYKHTFSFFKTKPDNEGIYNKDIFYHEVAIDFVSYENSTEYEQGEKNLYSKYALNETNLASGNSTAILDIVQICRELEDQKTKGFSSVEFNEKLSELNYLTKEGKDSLAQSLESIKQSIDIYLLDKMIENLAIYQLSVPEEELNVYVVAQSFWDKFSFKDMAISVAEGAATAAAWTFGSTIIAGATVAASAAAVVSAAPLLALGAAISVAIYAFTTYSSLTEEVKTGTANVGVIKNQLFPTTQKVKGVKRDFSDINKKAKEKSEENKTKQSQEVFNILKESVGTTADSEEQKTDKQLNYVYFGDIVDAFMLLLNDSTTEKEKVVLGNVCLSYLENEEQQRYVINLADIPVSLPFLIDYLTEVAVSSDYSLTFDRVLSNFIQKLKRSFVQYSSTVTKLTKQQVNSTFSPTLVGHTIYQKSEDTRNISDLAINQIAVPDNKRSLNIDINQKSILDLFSNYSRFLKSTSYPRDVESRYNIGKIIYIGSNPQGRTLEMVSSFDNSRAGYNSGEFCNHILTKYNIPCITVSNDTAPDLYQVTPKFYSDVNFSKIDDSNLMNSAMYNGANLLTLPYRTSLNLYPFMFMYLNNGSHFFIASPLENSKAFQFSGLYIITNCKLRMNIDKALGKGVVGILENYSFSVDMSHEWFGTQEVKQVDNPFNLSKSDIICRDFNQFNVVAGTNGRVLTMRR